MTSQPLANLLVPARTTAHRPLPSATEGSGTFGELMTELAELEPAAGAAMAIEKPEDAGAAGPDLVFLGITQSDLTAPPHPTPAPSGRGTDDARAEPPPDATRLPDTEAQPILSSDEMEAGRPGGSAGRTPESGIESHLPVKERAAQGSRSAAETGRSPAALLLPTDGGQKLSVSIVAAAGGRTASPSAAETGGRGSRRDSEGESAKPDHETAPGRAKSRPTGTFVQNFSAGGLEMAPKRMPAEGPAATGRADTAALRLSASGTMLNENTPTAQAGPVRDVGIRVGASAHLEVRVAVETAEVAGRIAAETGRLRDDLAGVGAELDALLVEVTGQSRAQEPGTGRGHAEQVRSEPGAAPLHATGEAAGREPRRDGDGGMAERATYERDEAGSESGPDEGRNPDPRHERRPAGEAEALSDGWNDDTATGTRSAAEDMGPGDGRTRAAASGFGRARVDRLG
jgi:hypothetical protein